MFEFHVEQNGWKCYGLQYCCWVGRLVGLTSGMAVANTHMFGCSLAGEPWGT
jgi:hypothetical protein